jgi:hypothetical protein
MVVCYGTNYLVRAGNLFHQWIPRQNFRPLSIPRTTLNAMSETVWVFICSRVGCGVTHGSASVMTWCVDLKPHVFDGFLQAPMLLGNARCLALEMY